MNTTVGWLRQPPDDRDYSVQHAEVAPLLATLKVGKGKLPASIDLRATCSPIDDQGSLGSCTAQAGVGLAEYFQRRAFGVHIDGSRLFVYKMTRNLLGWTGDTGAYLRTTMGALALCGVPPEKHWPYVISRFDQEPPAFAYALAQNFQALKYYTLDPAGMPLPDVHASIKAHLKAGLPSMFGFTCYESLSDATTSATGEIPLRSAKESVIGGHAVVAVGYDDNKVIKNHRDGLTTKGAYLIRNSWGTGWGVGGYGWLPYEYTLRGLATDWWTLISQEFVDTQQFG